MAKRNGWAGEGTSLHVLAAAFSGFVAAVACNPADVLKSRLMGARAAAGAAGAAGAGGAAVPTAWTIALQLWQREGLHGFYRGFLPQYARLGPTIMVQMPLVEALRSAMGCRAL